jgi:hypothetical protein
MHLTLLLIASSHTPLDALAVICSKVSNFFLPTRSKKSIAVYGLEKWKKAGRAASLTKGHKSENGSNY